jgi:RNA polymerase sigma factor (sigma-70 family)
MALAERFFQGYSRKGVQIAVKTAHETAAGLSQMHTRFLGFLRGRIGDSAAAEDILQAAYVKAIEHGGELREKESSVAWFYRILRNAIADHYRQNSARTRAMEQFTASWKDGYEPELKEQTCDCIREVIGDLKPEYRTAIEQIDLAEESVESFAASQETTANNAYVRLHRARKAVAKKLTEVCGTCARHKCIDCTCKHPAG